MSQNDIIIGSPDGLLNDICHIIEAARQRVAINVNRELTLMYWSIGERINKEVLQNQRAEYGKAIVSTLSTQLPWSAFLEVLPVEDALAREFYITMAANERWSVRQLRNQMDAMLYERTLISRKPEDVIKTELSTVRQGGAISPDLVFKSPYFLDFTGLKGYYSEKKLEDMIISGMQQFLMELGNGFSFVDRQKRIIIDGEDFYLDLLFYHRKLHRLVAIDLKRTKFQAAYKGQMELYLRWLDKYERQPGEESPLGLLLCAAGNNEQIQLLQLGDAGIQVAQYYTELPDKDILRAQLQKEIAQAKLRLENQKED